MFNLKYLNVVLLQQNSRRKAMKVCNSLWTNKIKRKGHSKINEQIKCNLYTLITRHPQVVQSPISNDCLKAFTRYSFEPRCMNNIKNIYQHTGKCDDQQNLKDIIDADILSTP